MSIHEETALKVFGEVNSKTIEAAKAINFACLYSMGEVKLASYCGQYPTNL